MATSDRIDRRPTMAADASYTSGAYPCHPSKTARVVLDPRLPPTWRWWIVLALAMAAYVRR